MKRTQTVPGFAFALAILVGASSYAEPTVTLAPGSTVSIAGTPTVNLSPGGTVTVSGMQFDSGGNLNPLLKFANPQSGQYDIWVGTIGKDTAPAVLKITELK